jgi:hypothetical protein
MLGPYGYEGPYLDALPVGDQARAKIFPSPLWERAG